MRRVASFTIATLWSLAAFGQSLLDCVDPDVLHALLLQGQGERAPIITAAVPPELSALRMPAGFTWIGSAERILGRVDATTNATSVTAAWRSNLSPDAAREATDAALAASGWEVQSRQGMLISAFRAADQQVPQTACRDARPLSFNASALDGVTYVLITIQRGNNNLTCSAPVRPPASPASVLEPALEPYVPRLEMPVDPATGRPARMPSAGTNYGGGVITASTEFTVNDSAGNIARHFARQMAEQGWTNDANWSGANTAGSTWSRQPDADTLLQSTLSVTPLDERQFAAVLRISKLQ